MSLRQRVIALPVTLPGRVPGDDECIEEKIGSISLIATHTFLPGFGNTVTLSISGPPPKRDEYIAKVEEDVGEAIQSHVMPGGIHVRSYPSSSQNLPTVSYHAKVSVDRITAICDEHNLNEEEMRNVQEVVVSYAVLEPGTELSFEICRYYLEQCRSGDRMSKMRGALRDVHKALGIASSLP